MTAVAGRTRLHPVALYEEALGGGDVHAVLPDGVRPLGVGTWCGEPDAVDELVLSRCVGPVLDVGCGPGRFVAALCRDGVPALGIDISAVAVARARARGGLALRRPLEGLLPGEGRWRTVLLTDGNVGIGGDVPALLDRCRALLAPGGLAIVEADPDPLVDDVVALVLRTADGRRSHPLPWARAGAATLARLAPNHGFGVDEAWRSAGRTIVILRAGRAPVEGNGALRPTAAGRPRPRA